MTAMSARACKFILWAIAALYAYGALVHAMNMAGSSGFDWTSAPLKWQILDIAYLGLDLVVVAGFVLGRRFGFIAFTPPPTERPRPHRRPANNSAPWTSTAPSSIWSEAPSGASMPVCRRISI